MKDNRDAGRKEEREGEKEEEEWEWQHCVDSHSEVSPSTANLS